MPIKLKIPKRHVQKLQPPAGGAIVRMYRIGHGDCFLLAFAGTEKPVHVLIDCGFKPGSPAMIEPPTVPAEIARHICTSTGNAIDIAVLTHEHQDHLNAINDKNFPDIAINQTWIAWTDDPDDDLAAQMRAKFKDRLLGLLSAHQRLTAAGDREASNRIADLLAFEFGGDAENYSVNDALSMLAENGGLSADGQWTNKKSMKYFKDKSQSVRYLRPGSRISLPGAPDVSVYVLGPPRNLQALEDLNPRGAERFGNSENALISAEQYFSEAASTDGGRAPFAARYVINWDEMSSDPREDGEHFRRHYGSDDQTSATRRKDMAPDNAMWRRIDNDWLGSAEQLAIDLNDKTNNSSLVLAFELGSGGKVLLFAADAQAGNWRSWADYTWTDSSGNRVDARNLLSRTVLYKVGHHGSHNATLNGRNDGPTPCIEWMAHGDSADEFTAMITAVPAWAQTQKGWNHPMAEIRDALLVKTAGRLLQTDIPISNMATKSKGSPDFGGRISGNDMFFDLVIHP